MAASLHTQSAFSSATEIEPNPSAEFFGSFTILPCAHRRKPDGNGGELAPSWFDEISLTKSRGVMSGRIEFQLSFADISSLT